MSAFMHAVDVAKTTCWSSHWASSCHVMLSCQYGPKYHLVECLPRRMNAVLNSKGGPTLYQRGVPNIVASECIFSRMILASALVVRPLQAVFLDAAAAPFFSPPLSSYLMFSPHQQTSLSADDWRSRRDEAHDRNQNILWLNFAAYCVTAKHCECCYFAFHRALKLQREAQQRFFAKKKKRSHCT